MASWCGNHFETCWVVVKAISPTWASRTTTKKIFGKLYKKHGFANPWVSLNQPSNCFNTVLPILSNTYGGVRKQLSPQKDNTQGYLTATGLCTSDGCWLKSLALCLNKECLLPSPHWGVQMSLYFCWIFLYQKKKKSLEGHDQDISNNFQSWLKKSKWRGGSHSQLTGKWLYL